MNTSSVAVAIFTSVSTSFQLCLNGEPILSIQPEASDAPTLISSQHHKEDRVVVRRYRHSVGEVTCLALDDFVSLPADSSLSVRFHSQIVAQGFLSVRKI